VAQPAACKLKSSVPLSCSPLSSANPPKLAAARCAAVVVAIVRRLSLAVETTMLDRTVTEASWAVGLHSTVNISGGTTATTVEGAAHLLLDAPGALAAVGGRLSPQTAQEAAMRSGS
jgi:hypothetical protein